MYTNGLKDRFGSPLISQRDLSKFEIDMIKPHVEDEIIHISEDEHEALQEIIEDKDKIAKLDDDNSFTGINSFDTILSKQKVTSPLLEANEIVVDGAGILTFTDNIDGSVFDTENPTASGYRYVQGIPTSFNNGVCYDIGEISDDTNLKNITFSASGRLIQTCELWFTTSSSAPINHQWPLDAYWIDNATGAAPTLLPDKHYRIVFRREPTKIIASIAYLY